MRDRAAYAMRAGTIASYSHDAFGPDGSACLGMYAAMKGGGMIQAGMAPRHEAQVYFSSPDSVVCDRAQYLYAMVCKLTDGSPFTTNVSNLLHLLDRKIAELEEHEISASEPMEPTKSVTVEAKEGELVCV